jgi:hypothetical protein
MPLAVSRRRQCGDDCDGDWDAPWFRKAAGELMSMAMAMAMWTMESPCG